MSGLVVGRGADAEVGGRGELRRQRAALLPVAVPRMPVLRGDAADEGGERRGADHGQAEAEGIVVRDPRGLYAHLAFASSIRRMVGVAEDLTGANAKRLRHLGELIDRQRGGAVLDARPGAGRQAHLRSKVDLLQSPFLAEVDQHRPDKRGVRGREREGASGRAERGS